ncbi:uncharacterized protein LOC118180442 [Stegodyphus dumicola]|uniref:uncharacterized protein LOC118180442 n=1 Tax=Stegodyphus dumicola TaxID=202533 RepID=UPI0015A965F1|nr:uncharacterized protein LOC118180442 [Stegodyphus dumicola]
MFHLLINFRLNKVAISADVEKVFLQIALAEKVQDAVRFLFVENAQLNDLKLATYRFKRVNFGIKSSPFLLAATIKEHIRKYRDEQPDVFEILNSCVYVDYFITGQDSIDEALSLWRKAKQIMSEANMNLHKLVSNDPELNGK